MLSRGWGTEGRTDGTSFEECPAISSTPIPPPPKHSYVYTCVYIYIYIYKILFVEINGNKYTTQLGGQRTMVDNGKSDETKFPSGREEKYRLVFHFFLRS